MSLTGFLTGNGTDLSGVFLNISAKLPTQTLGILSNSTAYTNISYIYPNFPGQVICSVSGPSGSGMIIGNMYWGDHNNTITTVANIGAVFTGLSCTYNNAEFVSITMAANITQQVSYCFKKM